MNLVQPIRDPDTVLDICDYLKKQNSRNYIMFYIGIYSGLRIGDILLLKVRDIKNRDYIFIKAQKTSKPQKIKITPQLKKEIKDYCKDKPESEYLIKSREGINKPLTRDGAYKILKGIEERFGLMNLGTHSMRKTFGYHHYSQYHDIVLLQKLFNHSTPKITLDYIGIDQDNIDKSMDNFKIKRKKLYD